jgi:trk system potassium uptake protein
MNYKMIRFVISWVLKVEGMLMLFPALVGAMYQEKTGFAYLIWGLLCIAAGLILCFRKPSNMEIYSRDGFVCVSLSWVVLGVFGAVPFVITGEIPFYINALFEIVSGFTTTGASILSDVEALSHASLFWRSFSHWIGGYGFSFVFSLIMSASCGCSPGTYGTTFLTFFSQLLISSFLSACGQEMHPDFIPSFCFFGNPCES